MTGNTLLKKQYQDVFNKLAWVLLDWNERQFVLAWRLWQQQRLEKKAGHTRATALVQRMR
jgi:hypothetical protein